MRFLYFAVLGLGLCSTAPQRLHNLFESVKEFARESGPTTSTQKDNKIIESAIRFARNEGRPLEHFVDILRTVSDNGISKCELDHIAWKAVALLYDAQSSEKGTGSVTVDKQPNVAAPVVVQPTPISDSESVPDRQGKRGAVLEGKDRVLSILEHLRSLHLIGDLEKTCNREGIEYLNYIHYKMVLDGEYEKLLLNLKLLGGIHDEAPMRIFYLFEDAYRKLTDPSYSIPESTEQKLVSEINRVKYFFSFKPDRARIMQKLEYICSKAAHDNSPFGVLQDVEDHILGMAKEGDLEGLRYIINLYGEAGFSLPRKRTLLKRAYRHMLEQDKKEIF